MNGDWNCATVDIDAIFIHATDRAVLVRYYDDTVWIPLSVCHIDPEDAEEGDEVVVTIQEWFAEKEGIV